MTFALSLFLAPPSALAGSVLEAGLTDDANEVQWVQVDAVGGSFRLSFEDGGPGISETGNLPIPATPAQLEAALNGLATVSAGGGSVTVEGSEVNGTYTVSFDGGPLRHADVPLLAAAPGSPPPSGEIGAGVHVRTLDPAGVDRGDERVDYTATVQNAGAEPTGGEVTLEVQLPEGNRAYLLEAAGAGWSCEKVAAGAGPAAGAVCRRSDPLAAGAFYPPVKAVAALGADPPERMAVKAVASCACAPAPAVASDDLTLGPPLPFGVQRAEGGFFAAAGAPPLGDPYTQAGGHPFLVYAGYSLASRRRLIPVDEGPLSPYLPVEEAKRVTIDLPRGEVGNALAVPRLCRDLTDLRACPVGSVVGSASFDSGGVSQRRLPVVAIEPEVGTPAELAFAAGGNLYLLAAHLRPEDGYATSLEMAPLPRIGLLDLRIALCGFGARVVSGGVVGCKASTDPDANPRPLFTNPTRCDPAEPPAVVARLDSWEHPGDFVSDSLATPPASGCDAVPFEPEARVSLTGSAADSPAGLEAEVTMPTDGLESAEGVAQAGLERIAIALPAGASINPAAAAGLATCAEAQAGLGSSSAVECPDSSRIGTAEMTTPLLGATLTGAVYLARQGDVDGALFGVYLVLESKRDGVLIKVPGRIDADPSSGRLTIVVDEVPGIPFSALKVSVPSGPRAFLVNPPRCGPYEIETELAPSFVGEPGDSVAALRRTSAGELSAGPGGAPCQSGALGARLIAGTATAAAGKPSPFLLQLSREDGSQRLRAFDLTAPPGLAARLRGVSSCSDAALASISAAPGSGREEAEHPSCPATSRIGGASLRAGAGPYPLPLGGSAFLAGPYRGVPISIAAVVPAVVGPFDLGSVVVRSAVRVDPTTAQISLESDPLPAILHGLLLDVRELRIDLDRPDFTLNPTSCEAMSVGGRLMGATGDLEGVSQRFQAEGCGALGFKPRLSLRLSGAPPRRGGHPELRLSLRPRPGDANVGGATVTLPRTELLDNAHVRGVCSRRQFASRACPAHSAYGEARAWSPLLDRPLQGPVYLRSSEGRLPDVAVALDGQFRIDLAGRIDSTHGRMRIKLARVPDIPVSRFELTMDGGRRGLLVNNTQLCRARPRAGAFLRGHNGKAHRIKPWVRVDGCK